MHLSGVTVRHGSVTALDRVDLDARAGELLVLLGPSAAGKTTLLRAVAGLDRVSAGTVRLAGRDITALPPGRRDVSMVFQSYALFPHLDVARNIAFGLAVRGVDRRAARERAAEAAAVAGCAHLLDRRPGALSGGERQRVALARALVREPAVFLLDEPLSQLDAELRLSTRGELRALHDRVGATTLHVTHDQAEAMALGDRVAVLRAGRVEQVAGPRELWDRPATRFVARFVGSPPMNLLPADRVAGAPPGAAEVGVRPEALRLTVCAADAAGGTGAGGPPRPAGGAGALRLAGAVTRCELAGADS
ncbi:MAG TPA: ABC transporter ATP-binding protein, partial [Pilimelia sp.]|nr:ABC transporter ATP-binding protein [Pilimelia sp.]